MTTCLTTFRTGLPGDSSTRWTLYQFFRTKQHVLDAISRKKLHPFAWGGRGRKFKSCHSDQKSVRMHNSCRFFSFGFLFTFNTFQAFLLFSIFLVHTKYIQPRYVHDSRKVCTKSMHKVRKILINQGVPAFHLYLS